MKTERDIARFMVDQKRMSQHTKCCSDCPWRRISIRSWLGLDHKTGQFYTPAYWLKLAHGETLTDCHLRNQFQCAGMAIYRANVCKRPRYPEILILPADEKLVFSTPMEFIAHHEKVPKAKTKRYPIKTV
jgi:hypothetical protein